MKSQTDAAKTYTRHRGGNKTKKCFSLNAPGLGAAVLQVQLMYVSVAEVNVNCVMEVLSVAFNERLKAL